MVNSQWSCNLLHNTDMKWELLLEYLLPFEWQRKCYIVPDYMPPFPDKDTKPIVVIRYDDVFLRSSHGPSTGTFWDVYGDDYHTPELALLELSKAPPPDRLAKRAWKYGR
jgi:hypothetical protein